MTDLDDRLAASAPSAPQPTPELQHELRGLTIATRAAATRSKRRRMLWAIPAVGASALALTAGGVIVSDVITFDTTIPITYTTAEGEEISCSMKVGAGSPFVASDRALSDYIGSHDWSGLGQQIYDGARANPLDPADFDVPITDPADARQFVWGRSAIDVLLETLPNELVESSSMWMAQQPDGCEGQGL